MLQAFSNPTDCAMHTTLINSENKTVNLWSTVLFTTIFVYVYVTLEIHNHGIDFLH